MEVDKEEFAEFFGVEVKHVEAFVKIIEGKEDECLENQGDK